MQREQAILLVVENYICQMNKWMGQDELSRELDFSRIILICNNGRQRFPFTYGISVTITMKRDMFLLHVVRCSSNCHPSFQTTIQSCHPNK